MQKNRKETNTIKNSLVYIVAVYEKQQKGEYPCDFGVIVCEQRREKDFIC